tara:strand:+ start:34 stop:936 length:903 start_codon:yes stop_codon:yes gene_type:complete
MANPTTNYGFVLPTSTDLVTDLPADFDVALQGVDTRLKALQPGTTLGDIAYSSATANTNTRLPIGTNGQVLSISGGVPAWATTADQTPLTTKGDLFTFTTVDARIGVGANGTVLTADSAEATGLKWAASSSGLTLVAAPTSFSAVSAVSVDNVFSASYDYYKVLIQLTANSVTGAYLNWRARVGGSDNTTAGNYQWGSYGTVNTGGGASGGEGSGASATSARLVYMDASGFSYVDSTFYNPYSASIETGYTSLSDNEGGNSMRIYQASGNMAVSTSYTGFTLLPTSGTITGKVSVYGYSV